MVSACPRLRFQSRFQERVVKLVVERNGKKNGRPFDLVVFDLDGTVLRRDLHITERTIEALRRLRTRGVRLVVATGRHYAGAREHARRLGFSEDEPVICYGGAMVRRISGETLLHRTVERDAGVEVLEWAERRRLHARVFLDGRIVSTPRTTNLLRNLSHPEVMEVSTVDSPAAWLREAEEEPTKLVLIDHPDNVGGWLEDARKVFAGRLFVTRSLPHYVEVGSLESTKSRALRFLFDRWGVDPARTIAFGDAENDEDMLRFAGCGVAVGGLNARVREAADVVVPPVDEDGVAAHIEQLLEDR
jgi:Cof subfamily protein (haloacid dehalogenase superfamily)